DGVGRANHIRTRFVRIAASPTCRVSLANCRRYDLSEVPGLTKTARRSLDWAAADQAPGGATHCFISQLAVPQPASLVAFKAVSPRPLSGDAAARAPSTLMISSRASLV